MTTSNPTTYLTIDAFLDSRASGEGSRHTLTSYRHDLVGFARWFEEHVPTEPAFTPEAVTPTDIREYRNWLIRDARRKPATVNRKLASYPRQNSLALALREVGRIERTLFTLDWLRDPPCGNRSRRD